MAVQEVLTLPPLSQTAVSYQLINESPAIKIEGPVAMHVGREYQCVDHWSDPAPTLEYPRFRSATFEVHW